MKSQLLILLFSIAVLTAITVRANADDQTEINALYARLQHAMKAQSPEQVLALLAPDFAYKSKKGDVLNGKQFVAQMKEQQAEVKSIKQMKIKVIKTVITGKIAKVTNDFTWAMEIVDKDGQLGAKEQHHIMASTGEVENDLVKTALGWRFLTLNTVNGKITMDGKSMERQIVRAPQQLGDQPDKK